ncbi:hypothetical protein AVEN_209047-1 [Araneus ventricosus]|uniref:Uncharacterized protein n=1 Tax=Araneus ventricosus TaxID=182803 RepID=A0A4Y2KK43_ARAVE|nr:hypothetical protein AVEN_209047-1 [Araneus ventricosus]
MIISGKFTNEARWLHGHQNLSDHGFFSVTMQVTGCLDEDGLDMVVLSHNVPNHLVYFFLFCSLGAASMILERPDTFEIVRQSMRRRCHACINTNGRNL